MPSIRATDSSAVEDILVVGFARDKKSKKFSIASGDLKVDKTPLIEALEDLGATAAPDEVIKLPGSATKLVVLTGLGEVRSGNDYPHEALRRAAGAAARHLAGHSSATFALPHSSITDFAAIAEGALLGAYAFDEFRGTSKADRKAPLGKVSIFSKNAKKPEFTKALSSIRRRAI
jgi:leucyl aminopeptidase